jgi:hypothetical protein
MGCEQSAGRRLRAYTAIWFGQSCSEEMKDARGATGQRLEHHQLAEVAPAAAQGHDDIATYLIDHDERSCELIACVFAGKAEESMRDIPHRRDHVLLVAIQGRRRAEECSDEAASYLSIVAIRAAGMLARMKAQVIHRVVHRRGGQLFCMP